MQPAPTQAPQSPPPPRRLDSNIPSVDKPGLSIFATLLMVATVIFVLGHIVFLFIKFANDSKIKTDTETLSGLEQQLNAKDLKAVDQRARTLKAATTSLDGYLNKRVDWNAVWGETKGKLLKRAKITSFTMDETGMVKLSGDTDSLTNLAKLLVSFQSSDKITNVKLSSSSFSVVDKKTTVTFSIDGNFDLSKVKVAQWTRA